MSERGDHPLVASLPFKPRFTHDDLTNGALIIWNPDTKEIYNMIPAGPPEPIDRPSAGLKLHWTVPDE